MREEEKNFMKEHKREVDFEFASRIKASLAAYPGGLLFLYFLTPVSKDIGLVFWTAFTVIALFTCLRYYICTNFEALYEKASDFWYGLLLVSNNLMGFSLGCISFFAFNHYGLIWVSLVIVLAVCGLAAGASSSMSPKLPPTLIFIFMALGPPIIWGIFISDETGSTNMSVFLIFFILMLFILSKSNNRWYWSSLKDKIHIEKQGEKLKILFSSMEEKAKDLSSSAMELKKVSAETIDDTKNLFIKSENVSSATEGMRSNIEDVAVNMEQATNNLNAISAAVEEMTATIHGIAGSTNDTSQITGEAVEMATLSSEKIRTLGENTEAISHITEIIAEISAQTNLLALNASVEAARAGEAGRGFLIVANEIKNLATETAKATTSIRQQIEAIQEATEVSIKDIESISEVVNRAHSAVASIARATEEQSLTMQEMAGHISQASTGIYQTSLKMNQNAENAGIIVDSIEEIRASSQKLEENGNNVDQKAMELNEISEELNKLMKN